MTVYLDAAICTYVYLERFTSLVGKELLLYTGSDRHVCVSSLKAVLTKPKQQHMMPWETQSMCIQWGRIFKWHILSGCVPIAREVASINHTNTTGEVSFKECSPHDTMIKVKGTGMSINWILAQSTQTVPMNMYTGTVHSLICKFRPAFKINQSIK